MNTTTPDSRRLSQLSEHEDPHHLAALFRSAKAAPEEDLPRLRWRLRASLRQRAIRPRRLLRIALITGVVFLTGGVLGAVVGPYWQRKSTGLARKAEPPAKATPRPVRKKSISAPAEASPAEPSAAPIEESPVESVVAPSASHRAPLRLAAQRLSAPAPLPFPSPPPEVPVAPAPPSPIAVEQALLGDILKSLRKQHDPRAALGMLEDHAKRFPGTVLAPEAAMLRAEALLGLGRNAEALAELDHLSLASMPNQDERLVLRGELRAAAGRWREAREDFETPLSAQISAGTDAKSRDAKERALWGRASARSHLGDEAGARADLALYLRVFPSGRFATQAAGLLQGSP
jgi:hypothetical protein